MKIKDQKKYDQWKKIESKLQVGDILLFSHYDTVLARSIIKRTGSKWTHAGLVFMVPDKKLLFDNILIVEALDKGIEVHRIQQYTYNLDIYDIGVKRVPGLSPQIRKKVLAYMFNHVDVPYNFLRLFINFINTFNIRFLNKYTHK